MNKTRAKLYAITTLSISIFSTGALCASIPTIESGNYKELCKEEWTKIGVLDQRMFNFCVSNETRGHDELVILFEKYKYLNWVEMTLNDIIEKWTKAGTRRDSLVVFELKHEIDSFRDLEYRKTQPGFLISKFKDCENQWKNRFSLISFCYKN